MVKPFVDAGMTVRFYPVYWQDGQLVQEPSCDSDVLFAMDYFGYDATSPDIRGYQGVIVRDVTHSLFSSVPLDGTYCFGSLRKWCGVWTGGFAWAGDGHPLKMEQGDDFGYTALRREGMARKSAYIRGEVSADKGYLKILAAAEDVLKTAIAVPAAKRDVDLALWLDAKAIVARRRANAEVLRKAFPEQLMFREMGAGDCPMFVPILVPGGKRDELRKYLIEEEIYCPVHWPVSPCHELNEGIASVYRDELSLVCDQRYSLEDMNRMVTVIHQFWKET